MVELGKGKGPWEEFKAKGPVPELGEDKVD